MKKLLLLCPIFLSLLHISSCHQNSILQTEDEVTIKFPDWSPQITQTSWPSLSRWKVSFQSPYESKTWYTVEKEINFKVTKNIPCSFVFTPITILEGGNESSYFYPAGFIYPYSFKGGEIQNGSWEEGFLASIMQRVILSKKESGISEENMENFLLSFNWKKAETIIEENLLESKESQNFYNPWLIDSQKLLENLSCKKFSSTLLNTTSVYYFSKNQLFSGKEEKFLTPFVPQNEYLQVYNQIPLKKNCPTLIGDGKKEAFIFTVKSAKNISREFIYMPIYFEEL